jgi:hypothetical protein
VTKPLTPNTKRKMNNSDRPAFPVSGSYGDEAPSVIVPIEYGITIREYYAGLAMQGMLSAMDGFDATPGFMEHLAVSAVKQADALIKALEPPKT